MSAAFALTADISLMTLGGALKRKERLSARLGDLLSELYIASATLKRFIDEGEHQTDLPLMQWAMEDSLQRIQQAFRGLLRNLPMRPLAWLLKLLIFPTGLPFHVPSDRLDHTAASLLLSPGEARDRLTRDVYVSDDPANRVGALEQALIAVKLSAPIEKTLRQAKKAGQLKSMSRREMIHEALQIGLLRDEERLILNQANRLRNQVIEVDVFNELQPRDATSDDKPEQPEQPDQQVSRLGAA